MNTIFLRIYGGIIASLVLVALLGVGALQLTNEVRSDQYREQLARGTFRLMADNLAPMAELDRRRALATWSRLIGVSLELQDLSAEPLDGRARGRLLRGQVLVEQTGPHAARVYALVSAEERLVLSTEVEQISEQLARATVYLLMDELVRSPIVEQPRRLAALKEEKQFGFDLRLATLEKVDLDEDQQRRVDEGDTVLALGKGGDSIRVIAGMVGTPWVLEVGPIYQMNPYPTELLVLIGALGLTLTGFILYLLVRRLERRLQALENAAAHLASGRLDARAPTQGADSVGRLASTFNAMAAQLQRLLSVQREMVRAVSHELRTPVARLRFGLEMIGDADSDEARRKYMEGMDGDIQELDKLVDEMLVYARLEQGSPELNYQTVDLGELLDQVIGELAPLRANIRVDRGRCRDSPESGALVEAEPRYLHRALQNLVSNAMRHAESRVRLSYSIDLERCRVDVEDDGPGVPEEAWEHIFTPFLRLDDSRTRASGGHGLGLSIVRRIIYWHAGRAHVGRSTSLGGAQFSLVWPRRQERGEAV
ncbi:MULTISPECIES: ATP-binding protein [unclassified Pseudomonas]|uniref:ATP-binding protein n=1 Tax=unclassified Pseudomonas TaxID=196821 RepID=UPI002448B6CA|nr:MULTISPECIES: ATP-binding protein [unclassified Pseudomonas]MDG9930610.1 ATP-binding protein [Pseudomonas sp. GD04042]MDH0485107.1 ATP-binding protein [Pseudomonas sp. GD04015]MDH0605713.1 ATP-binding protein [Pseudomonas sp. GD03869]MDH0893022.1 ATP-binding protein [Pseudomonas sp. GD03875]MDH1066219.1 ATP-binding protein [Pseudomonas sp. GD03985]